MRNEAKWAAYALKASVGILLCDGVNGICVADFSGSLESNIHVPHRRYSLKVYNSFQALLGLLVLEDVPMAILNTFLILEPPCSESSGGSLRTVVGLGLRGVYLAHSVIK